MKILEINSSDLFSTGNIMLNIADTARKRGHKVITASKYCKMSIERNSNDPHHIYIGNRLGNTLHRYWAWMTDLQDTGSYISTKIFIRKIERFKPDIIHLHDILGWYLNLDVLFNYIIHKKIPVVWTFHDCWAFTGRCIYFDSINCQKWKSGCGDCPQKNYMPGTWWFDLSRWNYIHKKRLFTSLPNLTIVTPSIWLANLTKESFLKNYPIKVINNGINLYIFKPTFGSVYTKLSNLNKKIILGVAGTWSRRKGLDVFIRLQNELPDNCLIVLVGINQTDLPTGCKAMAIPRTHNQIELAEIYTSASVLANPTLEDNFPTVNLEALACGTPVVTYNTGGSPESISNQTGIIVEKDNYEAFKEAVLSVIESNELYQSKTCQQQAQNYAMQARFDDYVDLMEHIYHEHNSCYSSQL